MLELTELRSKSRIRLTIWYQFFRGLPKSRYVYSICKIWQRRYLVLMVDICNCG